MYLCLRRTCLGGGVQENHDLDFLNSLDINNNNFVLSADSLSNSVDIKDVNVVDNEDGTKELQYNNKKVDSKTTFISISDVAGLNKLSSLVNDNTTPFDFSGYTIKLTKNLTLDDPNPNQPNFTPIGKDEPHKFNGTFDGQGHTISNLHVSGVKYAGLFGYLGSNATVKNLGIINSEISVTADNYTLSGGIAAYNQGTITNCYNTGAVNSTGDSGGIAAYNQGTITNCYNTGAVEAHVNSIDLNADSGGIAGRNFGTITNCYNAGNIEADSIDLNANLGGIAGRNFGTIKNCYNTGAVNATINNNTAAAASGGIAGYNYGTIANCYNTGAVNAIIDNTAASGGIAGWNEGTIENCYNTGALEAHAATGTDVYSGGIAALNSGKIENCYNTGTVTATSADAYSGGIAGRNFGTIKNCYNTGAVNATINNNTAAAASGGIAGSNEGGTIKNCYYLDGCVSNSTCNEGTELTSDAMTGLKLLSGTGENSTNLNDGQDPKPWSPDIFGVNNEYPILADVPTQIDPSKSANIPPQSAVYVTLDDEDDQAENYLKPFIGTNGNEVAATVKYTEDLTTKIISYQWYEMNNENAVGNSSSYDILQGTYYVKVTIDGYSYTSLTRTVLNIVTVTFDSNGGSDVGKIETYYGNAITKPTPDPTRTNCKFVGWYMDEELTSDYDFNTTVTKDITLYAKWEAEAEVIVKLGNDIWNTFDGEVYLYQNGEKKYTLNGSKGVYSKDVDPEEYQIHVKMENADAGDPVDTKVSIDLKDGNRSAEVKYWTVTFDYKDNKTDSLEKIILNDSSVTKPASPTRVGYDFEGWYTSADNGSTLSKKWNFSLDNVTENTTLYAKWKAIEYTVKYHDNGSTSGTVPSDYTLKINDNINVDINDGNLAKSGYIFRGWNYTPNASLALPLKTPLAKDVIEKYIGEDNILTLYAVWTPIPEPIYTLCLNSNDSTLQTKRYSGTYGTEVTLKSASDFGWNSECKFIEWNSKSDGSGISYKEGDKFSLGSETWNLYAIWSDSSYHTVSFDSNGGSNVPSQSIQDGYRASVPNAPTKQGHSFKHWSLNGTKYDFNQSVKEDITLKAEYEIISYKVTFYYNGEIYYSTVADYNTSLGDRMPSLPSDKDRWNTSENGKGNNFTSDSLITSDISVYAVSSDSISSSILIIGGSAAAILAAIAAWMFMRSRYN